jgi:hypothetical protein
MNNFQNYNTHTDKNFNLLLNVVFADLYGLK